MKFKASTSRLVRLAIVFSFGLIACTQVLGDDKHGKQNKHSKNHSNKQHSGHGHGFTGISLSPAGIGFTLQNQNFGIDIAPGTLRNIRQPNAGVPFYQAPGLAVPGMAVPIMAEPMIVSPLPGSGIVGPNLRTVVPTNAAANQFQAAAEDAFRHGDYRIAMRALNHASIEDPENGLIHLFGSQIAFAMGDYQAAANAILAGTDLCPKEDWYFVIQNFRRFYQGTGYVDQMNQLNEYCNRHRGESFAQALRAYHFQGLGEIKAANVFATRAFEIDSHDRLATRLFESNQVNEIKVPIPGSSRSILTLDGPQYQTRENDLNRNFPDAEQHSVLVH